MSKGSSRFHFILLGIGIGLIFSGTYFYINPQIEIVKEEYTDEEILEKAKEITLEALKEKNNSGDETVNNTDTKEDNEVEEDNETIDTNENQGESNNELGQAQEDSEEVHEESSKKDQEEQNDEDNQQSDNDEGTNGISDDTDINNATADNIDNKNKVEYVTVKIEKGDLSEIIAKKLYDAGVIDNVEEFHKYILDNQAEKKLDYGFIELQKGADFETLLEILTVK